MGLCLTPFARDLNWPTAEMTGRGTWSGIAFGTLVALASGVGVALGLLGNNTSSLVGVAISASILPPSVNCGMLLACVFESFCCYCYIEMRII